MNLKNKKCLIIVPHQDDEILGCCTLIKRNPEAQFTVVHTVPNTGPSKKYPYLHWQQLLEIRNYESKTALEHFTNVHMICCHDTPTKFRNKNNDYITKNGFIDVLQYNFNFSEFDKIFTVDPKDKHIEHQNLGNALMHILEEYIDMEGKKTDVWTFFVDKTEAEYESEKDSKSNFEVIGLTKEELEFKKNLCDVFQTQSHFLPNIVRRPEYQYERFYHYGKF